MQHSTESSDNLPSYPSDSHHCCLLEGMTLPGRNHNEWQEGHLAQNPAPLIPKSSLFADMAQPWGTLEQDKRKEVMKAKAMWHKAASPPHTDSCRLAPMWTPRLTRGCLDLSISNCIWYSRMHNSRLTVPILYNGPSLALKLPFCMEIWTPIEYMLPWAHLSPPFLLPPIKYLNWFSGFRGAHHRDRQTDRPTEGPIETDHHTLCIAIGRMHVCSIAMQPKNVKAVLTGLVD